MAEVTIKDHVQQGKDRLVTQWASKETTQGLLKSYLENVQTVENIYQQLLDDRSVYTAIGKQLDVIGVIVGELRGGKADPAYRQAIFNRIAINSANGTPEKIMEILKTITGSDEAHVFEHFPANVHAHVSGSPANEVVQALEEITPAGVSARLMFDGGIPSYIGAVAQIAFFDIVLENQDFLGLENGDTLVGPHVEVIPYEDRSYFPHSLETEIKNPLCGLYEGTPI